MDSRPKKFARHVAGRGRRFAGNPAALGRPRLRHVRPDGRAVGKLDALTRPKERERDRDGDRRNQDEPPIFADEVHSCHQFHCML